jgi:DNA polymerase-3 subunit gamma/tau
MLAFSLEEGAAKPSTGLADSSRITAPVSATDSATAPAPVAAEGFAEKWQAIRQAVADTPPSTTQAPDFDGNWRNLVDRLKLGGMARVLAQNCELAEFDGQRLRLFVPQTHKHLLDAATQEKLRAALREHFGKQVQMQISPRDAVANTPARQISQEKAVRQTRAEAAIHDDPFVRDLMDSFGATVVPSSIKPLSQ